MSRDELTTALEVGRLGHGRRVAARVVALADGRSESPGESWARLVMTEVGLPAPELQGLIRDETGAVVCRVDFLLREERVVVRLTWADLAQPERVRALVSAVIRLAAA